MFLTGTKCYFSHSTAEKLSNQRIKVLTKRESRWLKRTMFSWIFLFADTVFWVYSEACNHTHHVSTTKLHQWRVAVKKQCSCFKGCPSRHLQRQQGWLRVSREEPPTSWINVLATNTPCFSRGESSMSACALQWTYYVWNKTSQDLVSGPGIRPITCPEFVQLNFLHILFHTIY